MIYVFTQLISAEIYVSKVKMGRKNSPCGLPNVLYYAVLFSCAILSPASADSEAETLINFKSSLSNSSALSNWDPNVNLCTWNGIICVNGSFWGLRLENMGLKGIIDVETLSKLPALRTISFMNNNFEGPMPDIHKLGPLRSFYISNNKFSGEIPDDAFSGFSQMRRVFLANNMFTGNIPKSLGRLPILVEVQLQGNQFEGKIPAGLRNQNSTSFARNGKLCGKPLKACNSSKKKLMIIIIAVVVVVALIAIIITTFILRARRQNQTSKPREVKLAKTNSYGNKKEIQQENNNNNKKSEHGKLYFVRNDRERFELQDLLRASAEVLGSGSFGSSYKATLSDGTAMVVKRFREMSNVGKEEFYEHMRRLGRLSHPNLLPLVAFYYKKEEKLLITDFAQNASLASHLHGKLSPNQPGLDWPTRLNIIKGVARGLAYLYKELPNLPLPHGHLKSSNVLLDEKLQPLLSDYALAPVINKEHAHQFMVAYKSPEFTQHDRTTKKTDAWCLGILILEILTGKFPANYLRQGKGGGKSDLATWVNSVVREEWTGEVFDKDMKGTKNGLGEMLKLLKIGMCCCEWSVERRWELNEAIEKIEELKERDSDEDGSSYASDGDVYSSRAMTEEDFSFSVTG